MKRNSILWIIALMVIILAPLWLQGCKYKAPSLEMREVPSPEMRDAKSSTVEAHKVRGGKYPPYTPEKEDDKNMDRAFKVPDGPIRGDLKPNLPKIDLKEIQLDSLGNPVTHLML